MVHINEIEKHVMSKMNSAENSSNIQKVARPMPAITAKINLSILAAVLPEKLAV